MTEKRPNQFATRLRSPSVRPQLLSPDFFSNDNTIISFLSMQKVGSLLSLIALFFFLLFTLSPSVAFAQTNSDQVSQLRNEIERYEQEIEQLREEQEKLGKSITTTQEEAKTLQSEINNINSRIKYMENQIYLTNVNINKTGAEINNVSDEIITTQGKISHQKSAIGELLLEVYKQDRESLLVAVMKNANISDFLNRIQQTADVGESLLTLVSDLKEAKDSYESHRNTLENKKQELKYLNHQQTSQKLSLNETHKGKNNLLKETKGQEVEYQKLLTEAEELERQANLEVFRLEDKLRQAVDPNSLPLARPGVLERPAEGIVSQPYGCVETYFARRYYPNCNNGRGGFHNGLDIAARYGTPLHAAENGKVIAIGSAPSAYGVWAAIEHESGLVTAYAHMSVRNVVVGQQVQRGSVVGNMGNTGLSTGSHIHFMVYAPKTFTVQNSKISGTLPIGATLNPQDYI